MCSFWGTENYFPFTLYSVRQKTRGPRQLTLISLLYFYNFTHGSAEDGGGFFPAKI
jgi:hypothetical protein